MEIFTLLTYAGILYKYRKESSGCGNKFYFHKLSIKLGYEIPIYVCAEGLSLPHMGPVVISSGAKIGKCCRIIGATNGSSKSATIGDNVFIETGATKVIGEIYIASDCVISAGAVVTKYILEAGTTWGGYQPRRLVIMIPTIIWRILSN